MLNIDDPKYTIIKIKKTIQDYRYLVNFWTFSSVKTINCTKNVSFVKQDQMTVKLIKINR